MDEESTTARSTALVPAKERTVEFYGDEIPVAQLADGDLYVPLRPLTDFLGLDSRSQRHRIQRDPVLADGVRQVVVTAADGKHYAMLCLPLELLPGWLFGVQPSRVKPALAEKLNRYRAEAFRVLWRAFQADVLPAAAPPTDISPAEQALIMAEALTSLARSQLEQEQRLGVVEGIQRTMADYMRGFIQETRQGHKDLVERVTALELRLSSGATISEDQAAELALHVKTVAQALEQKGTTNGYQRVYSELYHRFRVGTYRNLPESRFDEALAWLRKWYEELTGEAPAEQGRLF